jgi:hypothetical protein
MTKYYAAYGSNLNKAQMKARCPKATALGAVELPKAQLIFNGVADVIFHETKTAMIGLWKITDECERELDMYEGVISRINSKKFKSGAYRKETVRVIVTKEGVEVETDALIYLMNRDRREMPMLSYLTLIKEGFKDFGLNEKWLREALVDTRANIAKQTAERAARHAKEDAERRQRPNVPVYQSVRSPHHGITDMFDGPNYNAAQAAYFDSKRGDRLDDVVWDDGSQHELTYTEYPQRAYTNEDVSRLYEARHKRKLYTKDDYRKASKELERHNKSGYKLPKRKSPHLFDEPSYRSQKVK